MTTPTEQALKIWDWITDETCPRFCLSMYVSRNTNVLRCAGRLYERLNDKASLLYYRHQWRKLYNLFSNAIDGTFVWSMLFSLYVLKVLQAVLNMSKYSQNDASIYATMREVLSYWNDIKAAFVRAVLSDNKRPINAADWVVEEEYICNTKTEETKDLDHNLDFCVCIGNLPAASTDAAHNEPQQVDATAEANTPTDGKRPLVDAMVEEMMAKFDERRKTLIDELTSTPPKRRGRPKKPFSDLLMVEDKAAAMARFHTLIDGKKGKDVALVIAVAIDVGILGKRLTVTQLKEEFGDIGDKSLFAPKGKVFSISSYSMSERAGIRKRLEDLS